MTKRSVAPPALNTTPEQDMLDRIEEEIHRLRETRPALSDRIDRATHILVTHLACPRQRPIRVRVRDGRTRFLVTGSGGAIYVVEPRSWSCTCPDYHRNGFGACKHGIACYLLYRASKPPRCQKFTCCGCDGRFPVR